MKKILSILFASVVALMATACYPDDELATFDLSKATAPVLGSYEMGTKALSVAYTPGKFNMGFNDKLAVNHMLVLTSVDGKAVSKVIATSNKDNVLTASVTALSNALVALGCQEEQTVSFEAIVRATMQNPAQDNGRNGHIDSKDKISVSGFVVTFPKGSPYMEYTETSPFGVIGALSEYDINWDGALEMWMTADGNLHVAKCVSLKAGDEFKFRKDQDWGVNYGGDFGSLDTPFSVSQDGPNIVAKADGLYDLWLDLAAGTATLTEAYQAYPDHKEASNWTVIGALSEYGINWDGDIEMVTDGTTHIAQAVKLAAGDEFKFRQDKDWAVNMGGDFGSLGSDFSVSQDGPNIKVGADGIFDLIVNPGAGTAQVVETMGGGKSGKIGGDEPEPGPEPEPVTGWNIIGLNGDWENDVIATQDGNVWTAYITAEGDTEFKWRKDGGWDENYGMEEGATITIGEPFAAAAGGPNISIGAGFWKVVLDTEALTITISNGDVWSLIGDFNSWGGDVDMVLTDGKWVSPVTALEGGFKLRHNHGWDENLGGNMAALGEPFEAVPGGDNISVDKATYIVTYDPAAGTIVVEKAIRGWNVIGLNGNWSDDVIATENNNVWTVRVTAPEATNFKWRKDGDWAENIGGTMSELGVPFEGSQDGPNIDLPAGFWLLTLDLSGATPMLTVSDGNFWSLIGVNGDWENDIDMTLVDGKWVSPETAISGEFKIRQNHGWDVNRGGTMTALGEPFTAEPGGANISVGEGLYVVTYDPAAETITVANARNSWSVIGVNGDWGKDYPMTEVVPGIWVSGLIEVESGDWKIRFANDWAVNRGGEMKEDAAFGTFIPAVPDGKNVAVTGSFHVVYNANNETIGTLGWGVVGNITDWNADIPMNLAADGNWYSVPVTLATTDEIKIRWCGDWNLNYGGEMTAVEEPFEAVAGGANIKAPEAGTYMVVYMPETSQIKLTKVFWGLIGGFNVWDGDVFMMYEGNGRWAAYNQSLAGEWKIRQGCGWDVNRGGVFAEVGEPFTAEPGGANINVGDLTNYAIVYDATAETITIVK